MNAKPNYVRPADLHSLTEWCQMCLPVIALADYNAVVAERDVYRMSQDVCLTTLEAVQKHRDALVAALEDALPFVEANSDGGVSHRRALANIRAALKTAKGVA